MKGIKTPKAKTIGELMEETRIQEGAQEYSGHEYLDLNRFAEDTRHMVIFDVLSNESVIGRLEGGTDTRLSYGGRVCKRPGQPGERAYQDSEPCRSKPRQARL